MKKLYSILTGCISWIIFNIGSYFIFEDFFLGIILIIVSLASIVCILRSSRKPKDKTNQVFWYLAPFVLGIVGSLVGYFNTRKRNPQLAENLIILGLLSLVVSALTFFIAARTV